MDYYVLSLPEATGLYLGLALQAMIRRSTLASWVPYLLITVGSLSVYTQTLLHTGGKAGVALARMVVYIAVCFGLCTLFWPEVSRFSPVNARRLSAMQVASYAASQDDQATIVTAADTGDTPEAEVLESPGFRLLLKMMVDTPLALARTVNQETHRPLRLIVSMSWLLGLEMTATVTRALADWIEGCYKPSLMHDQEFHDAITARDLMPWGDTPVARALATRETVPGSSTGTGYLQDHSPLGTMFLSNPGGSSAVRCDVYLQAVEMEVQRWLFTERSPAGTPLSQIFEEDLGVSVPWQARFLLYREMLRAMGRPAPAPSLAGAYGVMAGAHAGLGALGGALSSPSKGWLGGLLGGGTALINQFERALATFTWLLGVALWFVYWSPFMFGTALQVLVGLFPVVVCYGLAPQSQVRPFVSYFLALLYVCCSPLWFALVDLAARAAASQAPQSEDALISLLNWVPVQTYSVVVTVLALGIVFAVGAGVLFLSVRGMVMRLRT